MSNADEALVLTKNRMGHTVTEDIDEYVQAFIAFAATADGPVADLGCAFGFLTKELLKAGAKSVIANDLEEEHLKILWDSLSDQPTVQSRLTLMPGDALELPVAPSSLAGILAANWIHFLCPIDIRKAFLKSHELLKPNGMLCVVTASTRHGAYRHVQDLVSQRKADGDDWPGMWKTEELCRDDERLSAFRDSVPEDILFMDPDVLEREARRVGFEIVKVGFFARPLHPEAFRLDGQEKAGLIAIKPSL